MFHVMTDPEKMKIVQSSPSLEHYTDGAVWGVYTYGSEAASQNFLGIWHGQGNSHMLPKYLGGLWERL